MKITEIFLSEKGSQLNDYRKYLAIEIDGKIVFNFLDGEPEDAILSRDFNDCYKIVGMLKKVYKAGLNKKEIKFESKEVDNF